jgi:two-component system, NtrC family, sensor histidine kinase HydH
MGMKRNRPSGKVPEFLGKKIRPSLRTPLPVRIWAFSAISLFVGLLVAFSSYFSYRLSLDLRANYLSAEAQTIATFVESQLRGPSRRSLENLPAILEEARQGFGSKVKFLGIIDSSGQYRYHSEATRIGQPAYHSPSNFTSKNLSNRETVIRTTEDQGRGIFILSSPIKLPGGGGMGMGWGYGVGAGGPAFRILEVGIQAGIADFILIQARWQTLLSVTAFFILTTFSVVMPLSARRMLQMQSEQEQQKHWVNLGRLSASLAHEIRNPLGAIKGLSQLLMERMPVEGQGRSFCETIVNESKRLEDLVHSLLSFARLPEPKKESADLVALVRQVLHDMAIEWEKANIQVQLQVDQETILCEMDKNQIRQALWNLFLNSRDEMKQGGTLTVSLVSLPAKDRVILQIVDSGPGFSSDALQNLFEPFYTTKAQGNGLGLAIVQQIILRHSGKLILENAPQGGAQCTICLPII